MEKQHLPIRKFRVRCYAYGDFDVEATTAAGAKYQVFKKAREAGLFNSRQGFRDFLSKGWNARDDGGRR